MLATTSDADSRLEDYYIMLIFPFFFTIIIFVCFCEQDRTLVAEADEQEDDVNLDMSADPHSEKG